MSEADDTCRIDVWLWRARFFKTRAMAGDFVAAGRIRLFRNSAESRPDKPSRPVRPGDELVFGMGGRVVSVRVLAAGERRGPASEARALYEVIEG